MGLKEGCGSQGPDFYNKPNILKNILPYPNMGKSENENAELTQDTVV